MPRYSETSVRILRRFRAWILMRSFDSRDTDIYRAVHYLKDNGFFFADYSQEFFEDVDKLLRIGKVKQIKRLLVYEHDAELSTAETARIIQFHVATGDYDCRVIASKAWESILVGASLPPTVDLGIFGDRRAYRALRDKPDFVFGTWTGNRPEVKKLITLFEAGWQAGRPAVVVNGKGMTIRQLFYPSI